MVLGEITLLKSVTTGTTLKQHQNKYSVVGLFGAPKDLKMLAGQNYLYQNGE